MTSSAPAEAGMVMEEVTGCSCSDGMLSTSIPSKLRTEGPKPCKTTHRKYTKKVIHIKNLVERLHFECTIWGINHNATMQKYTNHAIVRLFNHTQAYKNTKYPKNIQTHIKSNIPYRPCRAARVRVLLGLKRQFR